MRARLVAPARFSFRRTVFSHGWCLLAPFRVDPSGDRLETVLALPSGRAAPLVLEPARRGVSVYVPGRPSRESRGFLLAAARRILGLGVDLTGFYRRVRGDERYRWIAAAGSGRLLRAPSAFEDLVKLVLTTNCSWALTTRMVRSLVDLHGTRSPDGSRSFPTAGALASVSAESLRETASLGYRAPYVAGLARAVAAREVDPEAWEARKASSRALKEEMLSLPGVGPYVAENLLKMLGRPDGLALDSWMRSKYARLYHGGRPVTDRTIARRYAGLGEWAALAVWCELTRDWFAGGRPSEMWKRLR